MAEDYAVIVSSTIVGMTVVVPLKVEALILWLPITFKEISFSHSLADLTTKKLTTKTGLITRCLGGDLYDPIGGGLIIIG
jgi:hypothetical protein